MRFMANTVRSISVLSSVIASSGMYSPSMLAWYTMRLDISRDTMSVACSSLTLGHVHFRVVYVRVHALEHHVAVDVLDVPKDLLRGAQAVLIRVWEVLSDQLSECECDGGLGLGPRLGLRARASTGTVWISKGSAAQALVPRTWCSSCRGFSYPHFPQTGIHPCCIGSSGSSGAGRLTSGAETMADTAAAPRTLVVIVAPGGCTVV